MMMQGSGVFGESRFSYEEGFTSPKTPDPGRLTTIANRKRGMLINASIYQHQFAWRTGLALDAVD
ncbi:hypothetical protein ETAA8_60260 [Anatilimnocola aggregata]|uniref:Uncharacterized protein n=1 Tax=Anatilimnocola aggregata TaxID=2528021 RepID=A0A517YKW5_9BACT|nr:hypothetical protein ETAA8_60260 [Anatilimnocola aggregata]